MASKKELIIEAKNLQKVFYLKKIFLKLIIILIYLFSKEKLYQSLVVLVQGNLLYGKSFYNCKNPIQVKYFIIKTKKRMI